MEQAINTPEITVLMPVFNNEKYLKQAIESILAQTYKDFELLIIDDGSTDGSNNIIQSFTDSRIRLVKNDTNEGLIKTLNKGIELAKGEFIARMDGDDIALPKRLEKQVEVLKSSPSVSMVACCISIIDEAGEEQGFWGDDKLAITNEQIRNTLPNENCIAHPSVMIRKDKLMKYKYSLALKDSEDWDLWLRMASDREEFYKIKDVLLKYRVHPESVTVKVNRSNIYRKKRKVQVLYCLHKLGKGRFNNFDFRVLKSAFDNYVKDAMYSINPNSIRGLRKVLGTNIFTVLKQYSKLKSFCTSRRSDKAFLNFFFPYFHVGGAEKIHYQILESVKDKSPVVFITGVSTGNGYYMQFKNNATIIDISLISDYPLIHKWVKNTLAKHVSKCTNPVVFGCNSPLYYGLLPFLDSNVKCIDLVHAFVHPNETGPEKWSLPVVERINQRIIISKNTIDNFKAIYEKSNISASLLSRIKYISNCTFIPQYLVKQGNDKLNVLYVGRSTSEKRTYLVEEIARKTQERGFNVEFSLVGKIASTNEQSQNCKYLGEISGEEEMHTIYRQADILLLTSSREGFPMVIMEAMAFGAVVITTAVGGIPGVISNNETGILVSSESEEEIVKDFVNAIEMLKIDPDKYNALSQKAYTFAKDNFDKTKFLKSYRQLLLD